MLSEDAVAIQNFDKIYLALGMPDTGLNPLKKSLTLVCNHQGEECHNKQASNFLFYNGFHKILREWQIMEQDAATVEYLAQILRKAGLCTASTRTQLL